MPAFEFVFAAMPEPMCELVFEGMDPVAESLR